MASTMTWPLVPPSVVVLLEGLFWIGELELGGLTAEGGDACAADGEVGGPGDGVDVYFDVPFAFLDWEKRQLQAN